MTDDQLRTYRLALQQARTTFEASTKRLEANKREQSNLEDDIARLRKTITALSAMCSENPGIDKLGITDSVMSVMAETPLSWSTGEVVTALDTLGFDLASQKNAAASVHAVLTRLAMAKKIVRATENVTKNSAGQALEWRGPKYDPDQEEIPF